MSCSKYNLFFTLTLADFDVCLNPAGRGSERAEEGRGSQEGGWAGETARTAGATEEEIDAVDICTPHQSVGRSRDYHHLGYLEPDPMSDGGTGPVWARRT